MATTTPRHGRSHGHDTGHGKDRAQDESDLLGIREAAALMRVSEISLRRWTNDGRLPCLRVGARGIRRFRRGDLMAFLGGAAEGGVHQRPRPGSGFASPTDFEDDAVRIEDALIPRGSHLCALYRSDLGRIKLARPFLADGLRQGETCILVAEPRVSARILEALTAVGLDIETLKRKGRLVVREGMGSGSAMLDYLERFFVESGTSGRRLFRLLGDMAWALDMGIRLDELMAFERAYNHTLARRFACVSLCQYDSRRFSGTGIHEALLCHEDTFDYPLSRFL